jgi:hypothetical protein
MSASRLVIRSEKPPPEEPREVEILLDPAITMVHIPVLVNERQSILQLSPGGLKALTWAVRDLRKLSSDNLPRLRIRMRKDPQGFYTLQASAIQEGEDTDESPLDY